MFPTEQGGERARGAAVVHRVWAVAPTIGLGWQTGRVNVLAAGDVSPGLLGFTVVALIGFALFFLIKSMNRQIAKIEVPHEADLDKKAE